MIFEYFISLKIGLKRKDIKHNSEIKKYKRLVSNDIVKGIYGIYFL